MSELRIIQETNKDELNTCKFFFTKFFIESAYFKDKVYYNTNNEIIKQHDT